MAVKRGLVLGVALGLSILTIRNLIEVPPGCLYQERQELASLIREAGSKRMDTHLWQLQFFDINHEAIKPGADPDYAVSCRMSLRERIRYVRLRISDQLSMGTEGDLVNVVAWSLFGHQLMEKIALVRKSPERARTMRVMMILNRSGIVGSPTLLRTERMTDADRVTLESLGKIGKIDGFVGDEPVRAFVTFEGCSAVDLVSVEIAQEKRCVFHSIMFWKAPCFAKVQAVQNTSN